MKYCKNYKTNPYFQVTVTLYNMFFLLSRNIYPLDLNAGTDPYSASRIRIRIAHPGSGSTSLQFTSLIFLQGKIDDEFLLEELSNCSWREPDIIVEERTYKDLVKKNINYNSF